MLIEVSTFALAAGTDEAAFLAADATLQAELMAGAQGFVRRTTARGIGDAAGRWAVVTLWWSAEHADAAASSSGAAARALSSLIDGSSQRVERFETLD